MVAPAAPAAAATGAQPPQQRLPTRAEVVAPFLEDFRFFLQHVDEFKPMRHTPAQVDGVRRRRRLGVFACGLDLSERVPTDE